MGDFKKPIFQTVVIAATTYFALNFVWAALEYDEREKELQQELAQHERVLEETLARVQGAGGAPGGDTAGARGRGWRSWLRF